MTTDAGTILLLDCGTGARELGLSLQETVPRGQRLHILIGHTHWDHIQGFPFFLPTLLADYPISIYAPVGFERSLEDAIAGQMQYAYFPVRLRELPSQIQFTELEEGTLTIDDVVVRTQYLNHTAPTLGYRLSADGADLVYCADHEPFWETLNHSLKHPGDRRHVEFLTGADLIIHDAQYTAEEYRHKVSWGHSPIEYAIAIANRAGARRLALFHHDPLHDDDFLDRLTEQVRQPDGKLDVFAAAEGQEVDLPRQSAAARPPVDASALGRRLMADARVLVVDDDSDEVQLISDILAEDGIRVSSAQDGESALSLARVLKPDLLVVDASLRVEDGRSLVEAIRAIAATREVPIVLLVPRPAAGTIADFDLSAFGMTDLFARPFSSPMLRSRVRAWLARVGGAGRAPAGDHPGETLPSGTRRRAGTYARIADRAEFLGALPLFGALSSVERWRLALSLTEHVYRTGTEIVVEGEPGDALYLVRSGFVRISSHVGGNRLIEARLSELGKGEIFGELSLLDGQPRSASVIAVKQTRCLMLSQPDFVGLLRRSPDFALSLLRLQATRLRTTDLQLAREAPDLLTGLAGPRALDYLFRRAAASARRRNTGLALLAIELANRRIIRDLYGRLAGDEALRRLSGILAGCARAADIVGRWSGDEFVLILTDAQPDSARLVAARIRRALQGLPRDPAWPVALTASIKTVWSNEPPLRVDQFLATADPIPLDGVLGPPSAYAEPG